MSYLLSNPVIECGWIYDSRDGLFHKIIQYNANGKIEITPVVATQRGIDEWTQESK